jgi:hypothetical protein
MARHVTLVELAALDFPIGSCVDHACNYDK